MNGRAYSSDLTNAEWNAIAPLLGEPALDGPGRPELRYVINGMLFLLRSGAEIRPAPPWSTTEAYYAQWQANGTWAKVMATLLMSRRQSETSTDGPERSS